jgi:hypothetical protein
VTVLTLLWVAAGRAWSGEPYREYLEECAEQSGWRTRGGEPMSGWGLVRAADRGVAVLEHALGFEPARALGEGREPTVGGRLLARAALLRGR